MQGMSIQSIKKHPSLIPLYAVLAAGVFAASFYLTRLAVKNPDVSWSPRTNQEPWNDYKNKRYQFLHPGEGKKYMERLSSLWD